MPSYKITETDCVGREKEYSFDATDDAAAVHMAMTLSGSHVRLTSDDRVLRNCLVPSRVTNSVSRLSCDCSREHEESARRVARDKALALILVTTDRPVSRC